MKGVEGEDFWEGLAGGLRDLVTSCRRVHEYPRVVEFVSASSGRGRPKVKGVSADSGETDRRAVYQPGMTS